jgi:hypothetical protein
VVLPKPYVPEGQVWQAVEVPSMKNVPELQQTPTPAAVQRTVPPAAVQPEDEQLMASGMVKALVVYVSYSAAALAAENDELYILTSLM